MPVEVIAAKPPQPQGNFRFIGESQVELNVALKLTSHLCKILEVRYVNVITARILIQRTVNLTDPVFRGFHHGRKKHEGWLCQRSYNISC